MRVSTIFQTALHFYFNYHYVETTLTYVHSSFIRRIQIAIRMVVTFLVGGFIAYGTSLNDQFSQEFLIPLLGVLSVMDTFGLTVAVNFQSLLAMVPTAVFLFIVQKIGLGYHHYLAAELLFLLSSFSIAFVCSPAQNRKSSLALCAIFFASIVNQPVIPSIFIFHLLARFILAMAVAVLVSLTVFPVFATIDIENRVNYCLVNLQEMQTLIIKAFLRHDQMSAQIPLIQASTIEQMIRTALGPIQMKVRETRFEPSRFLQRIFNRRRRHIIDLTVQEQIDLIFSWFLYIRTMQSMIKQCRFNDYHNDLSRDLQTSILQVCSRQATIISTITKSPSITKDEYILSVSDLDQASEALRSAYNEGRIHRVENALESGATLQAEDHLSHAFFLFQLETIARLFTTNVKKPPPVKQKKSLKERLTPKLSRLFSATKCMLIMGVGSIFIMVPALSKVFENGQWILITICMVQGDSIGGSFTTMKMRFFGTLLGAMWGYVTYLAVNDNIYHIFGMLVPWILVFGYIKSSPGWGYTAAIAAVTPGVITLGQIPYRNTFPAGNYGLLRIEETFVGIGISVILTLIIFPVFAIDLLKENIQITLNTCRDGVSSLRSIYNQLSYHEPFNEASVDIEQQEQNLISVFDEQRNPFYALVSMQRSLIEHAAAEPSFWWFNNNFSNNRYTTLIQQEIDIFQILYSIDTTWVRVNEYLMNDEKQLESIQTYPAGMLFPSFHTELAALCNQLSDCLGLWSSYFAFTQTRFYRFFNHCIVSQPKLNEAELLKHEQNLVELHQTVYRLQKQHQDAIHRILAQYRDLLSQGDAPSTFLPQLNSKKNNLILMAISAMYFATAELARVATTLGTNIYTIYELETTHRFINY